MSERGAAVIEFALILPLLLIIISFIIDGSRMFQQHLLLGSFAREVARYGSGLSQLENGVFSTASPPPAGTPGARLYERAELLFDFNNVYGDLPDSGFSMETAVVDTSGSNPDLGEVLTVTVTVQYRLLFGYMAAFFAEEVFTYPVTVSAQIPRLE